MPLLIGLGGQGVAELVGVDVADAGDAGAAGDDAGDAGAVEGSAWLVMSRPVSSGPAHARQWSSELDQDRVQRDVAVGVELADGDAQPVGLADGDDGVGV